MDLGRGFSQHRYAVLLDYGSQLRCFAEGMGEGAGERGGRSMHGTIGDGFAEEGC